MWKLSLQPPQGWLWGSKDEPYRPINHLDNARVAEVQRGGVDTAGLRSYNLKDEMNEGRDSH